MPAGEAGFYKVTEWRVPERAADTGVDILWTGEDYVVLRIDGEGYFHWIDLAAEKQVAVGDRVRLRVSNGQWPRVYDLEKLPQEQGKGKTTSKESTRAVSPGPQGEKRR